MSDDSRRDRHRAVSRNRSRMSEADRGRRAARRSERRRRSTEPSDRRGLLLVLGVVVVGAAVVATTQPFVPVIVPSVPTVPVIEPIASSALACPEPGGTGQTLVTAAVIPGLPGQSGSGSAAIATLAGEGAARRPIEAPGGQTALASDSIPRPSVVAPASGALAPGWIADQRTFIATGSVRSLSTMACVPAGSQSWFVGGSSALGRYTKVVLVNPDSTSAELDIDLFGATGPIPTQGGRGIVVRGGSRATIGLRDLGAPQDFVVMHVTSRVGRIAVAVEETATEGSLARGRDWVPASAAPARSALVPGVPAGPGARELLILAPGDRDATARIRLLTASGSFVPAGLQDIDLPAGTVVRVGIAPALKQRAATVLVDATEPIVAGMRSTLPGATSDTSFSSATAETTGPSAASGLPSTLDVSLAIAARTAAQLDISVLAFTGDGQPGKPIAIETVKIAAGRSVSVALTAAVAAKLPEGTRWYTAVATPKPGSGAYVAAHVITGGTFANPLLTGHPWLPLRVTVEVPQARQDQTLSVPRSAAAS